MTLNSKHLDSKSEICHVAQYHEELRDFLTSIANNVIVREKIENQSIAPPPDRKSIHDGMSVSIMREVVRNEIRTIRTLLQEGQQPNGLAPPSAQQATVRALQRKVRETLNDLEKLKYEKKGLEADNLYLKEEVARMFQKSCEQQKTVGVTITEQKALESQMDRSNDAVRSLEIDQKRLQKCISSLQSEISAYQDVVGEREVRNKFSEQYIQDLENRILELIRSETTLTVRVDEMFELHQQALSELKRVIDTRDLPAVLQVFHSLSSRLAEGTGKFKKYIQRKYRRPGEGNEEGIPDNRNTRLMRSRKDGESVEQVRSRPNQPTVTARFPRRVAEGVSSDRRSNMFNRLSRLGLVQSFSGAGNDVGEENEATLLLTRAEKQRTYEKGLLQSREYVERNCEVLYQIISLKNSEILRLEDELKLVSEHRVALEKEYQAAVMTRRRENRTVHASDDKYLIKRREPRNLQSLFDGNWFNDEADDERE